jgi:hypothetical protein
LADAISRLAGKPLVEPPSRREGQPIGRIDLGDHIGDLKADALELGDLLAELLALRRIADSA